MKERIEKEHELIFLKAVMLVHMMKSGINELSAERKDIEEFIGKVHGKKLMIGGGVGEDDKLKKMFVRIE